MSFLCAYPLASFVVILFVEFEADEVPLFLDASDCGRPAAHERVKDGVAFLAPSEHLVNGQLLWKHCRMPCLVAAYAIHKRIAVYLRLIEPSGMCFMPSRQSMLYILSISIFAL